MDPNTKELAKGLGLATIITSLVVYAFLMGYYDNTKQNNIMEVAMDSNRIEVGDVVNVVFDQNLQGMSNMEVLYLPQDEGDSWTLAYNHEDRPRDIVYVQKFSFMTLIKKGG